MRTVEFARSLHWAMTEPALVQLLMIAERQGDPRAVEAALGEALEGAERATVRDGVAVIPVRGPLFRYANLFARISGATSYEITARDFAAALADDSVRAIVLNIDSPGGEANGAHELAEMIHAARGTKPVIAYVGGMGASAAYWLASAADEIVMDQTAMLGSIGVIFAATRKSDEKAAAEIVIVSDQSPDKHTDPATDSGYERMRALATQLAAVFIRTVARNRGVSEETVIADFGRGWVKTGQDAVDAGLADRFGSFESVLAELAARTAQPRAGIHSLNSLRRSASMKIESTTDMGTSIETTEPTETGTETLPAAETSVTESVTTESVAVATTEPAAAVEPAVQEPLATAHAVDVAAIRAEAAAAENARMRAIESLALPGHDELLAAAKTDMTVTPEMFAAQLIRAEQAAASGALRTIQADEADLAKPAAAVSPEVETNGNGASRAKVQRILTAGRRVR